MSKEVREVKVGLRGFICPKGLGNVPFSYCEEECADRCHPLPLLKCLGSSREVIKGHFSVTQLNKPIQQLFLERSNPFYVKPLDQIWLAFGTATHAILEAGYREMAPGPEKDEMDVEFKRTSVVDTPHCKVELSGTPDVVASGDTMDDWKTVKEFSVKKLQAASKAGHWAGDDYFVQQNVYRAMWYPEVTRIRLVCLVKDWTERGGLSPVEYINVPIGPVDEVKSFVTMRLTEMVGVENGNPASECLPKDLWGGKRCKNYCPVNYLCPQFLKEKK